MKFKALVTSILLASSSVALADTTNGYAVDDAYDREVSLRDHRGGFGQWRRPNWAPISEVMTAARRNVITLAERNDELRAIRLQNGSGATYIYSLTLRFDDGSREQIAVGKWLYAGVPLLTFDIPQHRGGVDRIVVNTWTSTRSTYQVLGQRAGRFQPRPPVIEPQPLPQPPPLPPIATGIVIGKDLTFANSAGYVHVPVGPARGSFSKLRIDASGSGTFIGRVYVTFPTGAHQMFDVDKSMYRGESLTLDLNGRTHQITAITVMAGNDVRAVGQSASRFSLTLL